MSVGWEEEMEVREKLEAILKLGLRDAKGWDYAGKRLETHS